MDLDLVTILVIVVLGAVAGWAASLVVKRPQGLIADIITGIVGAFLGSFLFGVFGAQGVTGIDLYSFLVALVGAIALLLVIRLIR
ncbi:MAG: GlsB/YeaQ/YmgE family stress response membrane protein [Trueperaceae bacterium]|nr:GlsB/YeaQ/YmgE family stress response membrane protein [Trueperaceae bacterium]